MARERWLLKLFERTRCLLSLICFEAVATTGSNRKTLGAGCTVVRLKIRLLLMSCCRP